MVECGICGTDQSPLYCGGCASHLTLRSRINVIKVNSQLADLKASVTQAIEGNGSAKPDPGSEPAAHSGENEARTGHLQAQINLLQRQLGNLQTAVTTIHDKTAEIKQQSASITNHASKSQSHIQKIEADATAQVHAANEARTEREAALEKGYRDLLHLSLGLQTKCCQDLLEIFALKKKRKKNGYEIVLGFAVVGGAPPPPPTTRSPPSTAGWSA